MQELQRLPRARLRKQALPSAPKQQERPLRAPSKSQGPKTVNSFNPFRRACFRPSAPAAKRRFLYSDANAECAAPKTLILCKGHAKGQNSNALKGFAPRLDKTHQLLSLPRVFKAWHVVGDPVQETRNVLRALNCARVALLTDWAKIRHALQVRKEPLHMPATVRHNTRVGFKNRLQANS